MKRILLAVPVLVAASISALAGAPSAHASCAPDGALTNYATHNVVRMYQPTNLASPWQAGKAGGSITYHQTATESTSASLSTTVGADAGVIFAHASTSIGVTVGKTWTYSQEWNNTLNTPSDANTLYRMHLYHVSYTFLFNKVIWSNTKCAYVEATGYPTTVGHAPMASHSGDVFLLDQQPK